ncbi:acyltransferase family protein [Silvimonas iriomotensis]|uniref:Acyltransferase n=1 Tax=Silvimonas iriomotensis TaxID=449662 RepID=A0ABQ2P9P7_9NEIS|nr:acyltransferase [Silvimonas iriomotensis]GGP21555.1 acyltransferase [Silvimonas iriomotensis]
MSSLPSAPAGATRYAELESLRGLAALLVVLFHVPGWNSALHDVAIIRNGALMVQLFFVLSGFVIYTAYGQKLESGSAVLRFQLLRLGRLYPVHLLMLAIFLAVEFLKSPLLKMGYNLGDPFVSNTWHAFFQQLLLIQAIGPHNAGFTFNGPAWSISVEFYTYLLFAGVVCLLPRIKLWVCAVLALGAMYMMWAQLGADYVNLVWCVAGFFLGCLIAALVQARSLVLPAFTPWLAFGLLLAFLQFNHSVRNDVAIFPLAGLLILGIVCGRPGLFQRVLRAPALQWLGQHSYAIYMVHAFVLYLLFLALFYGLPDRIPDDSNLPQLQLVEAAGVYLVFLAVTLALASALHRYVETPWRTRSRRWIQQGVGAWWIWGAMALLCGMQYLSR